jgi:hypothetical protein
MVTNKTNCDIKITLQFTDKNIDNYEKSCCLHIKVYTYKNTLTITISIVLEKPRMLKLESL